MSKKLLLILVAVIVSVTAAATVFAVAFTASEKPVSEIGPVPEETDENNEMNETEGEGLSETTCEPEREYTYLRGTLYKNLYETKYQNLVETTKEKEPEPVVNEGSGGGYVGGGSVGSIANPGYSGSAGSYSMSDKTVAAGVEHRVVLL